MVDTGNSIFPIIEMYPLPKDPTSYVKAGKRYLHIKPSSPQIAKNENMLSANEYALNPDLGTNVEGEKIWGRKYKIRLTSKSTGKKLDINFNFELANIDEGNNL